MTDPAGERTPRRRSREAAEPATGDAPARARPRTAGRAARGGAGADAPARARIAEADEPAPPGRAARKRAGRSAGRPAAEVAPDRPEPVKGAGGQWPMADRSVLPTVLGVPPIAAVGLAAALNAIGVLVDLTWVGNLGTVFTICHMSGCVLAVAWVRRNALFGPMVQPPLLVAAAVPVVVLLAGAPRPGQGVAEQLLVIGAPLVNAFPVMAWTTGVVLVLGLLRVLLQRPVG